MKNNKLEIKIKDLINKNEELEDKNKKLIDLCNKLKCEIRLLKLKGKTDENIL